MFECHESLTAIVHDLVHRRVRCRLLLLLLLLPRTGLLHDGIHVLHAGLLVRPRRKLAPHIALRVVCRACRARCHCLTVR
eukprot:COSAG06_NODE_29326_length_558_cov_1.858388_2_plen_79_part_01